LSDPSFARFTKASLQLFWERHITDFDLIIVNNEPLAEETVGLLLMSAANTNLFVLDSRRTPENQIVKTALQQKEFDLPNVQFVLNRAGHNPSVIGEIATWVMNLIKRTKRLVRK
jgi:hypothetical protein